MEIDRSLERLAKLEREHNDNVANGAPDPIVFEQVRSEAVTILRALTAKVRDLTG